MLTDLKEIDKREISETELVALVYEMLDQLGSTDPELRDGLLYPTLTEIIESRLLSDEELGRMVEVCMDDKHMFYNLGQEGDGVFMRSFACLVIVELLVADAKSNFLSAQAYSNLFDRAIWYIAGEVDTRGYVPEKGWAHAIAHGADMLAHLVSNPTFGNDKIAPILDAVESCLFKGAAYADDEDVRLVYVIKALMVRGLDSAALTKWVTSIQEKLELLNITDASAYSSYRHVISVRNFAKSLYFSLKMDGSNTALRVNLFNIIRDLHKLHYGGM